jgi:dephospho-CoA kinase
VTVVDADRLGHEVLAPGGDACADVTARWPEVAVGGVIDRRSLGRIVFGDPAALAELESVTHPAIRRRMVAELAAVDGPVVVEVPIPAQWLPATWTRVVVDAPDEVRVARLRGRGMTDEEIDARMAAQPSRGEWLALADHVVDNGGDVNVLDERVSRLVDELFGPEPR